MRTFLTSVSFVYMLLAIFADSSHARIEYAVDGGIVSCTTCHVSPTGGGILTVGGKQFGLHGFKGGPYSTRDLFQVDLRALAIVQEYVNESRDGLGLMEVLGAANVPLQNPEEDKIETRFVATYNFGTFMTGLRETYLRWKLPPPAHVPEYILFGLVHAPFGLLTDEHRTYVRVQTRTTHNDFYMGALGAGEVFPTLHMDFALSNGFQNSADEGGGRFSQGLTAGVFLNFRWVPQSVPVLLGTSFRYNVRHSDQPDPIAGSVYGALSLGRLTKGGFNGTLETEAVVARYWNDVSLNPELQRMFLSSPNLPLVQEVEDSSSLGLLTQFIVPLSRTWSLLYKLDYLNLGIGVSDDTFTRHGLGFRLFASRSLTLQGRYEFAETTARNLPKANIASQNSAWLLFHYWF